MLADEMFCRRSHLACRERIKALSTNLTHEEGPFQDSMTVTALKHAGPCIASWTGPQGSIRAMSQMKPTEAGAGAHKTSWPLFNCHCWRLEHRRRYPATTRCGKTGDDEHASRGRETVLCPGPSLKNSAQGERVKLLAARPSFHIGLCICGRRKWLHGSVLFTEKRSLRCSWVHQGAASSKRERHLAYMTASLQVYAHTGITSSSGLDGLEAAQRAAPSLASTVLGGARRVRGLLISAPPSTQDVWHGPRRAGSVMASVC
ncbi:hypothetical protein SVAN01_09756 [Stagonosporopsis vannaccii]|nr:hypothetical protein SVAN01_09756 [Stagonosporopsis vannaccii]